MAASGTTPPMAQSRTTISMAASGIITLCFSVLPLLISGQSIQANTDVLNQIVDPVLSIDSNHLVGKVDQHLNFTISLSNSREIKTPIKIFWETTGPYISPEAEDRNVILKAENEFNASITITSSIIGIYSIKFFHIGERGAKAYFNNASEITVVVQRQSENIKNYFTVTFTALLSIALFFMGMDINLDIIKRTLKHPIGPCIGVTCQFLIMPVIAYGLGYIFLHSNYERFGFLFIGCSPGGAHSNLWTSMFGGDIDLSVTMTFISSLFSFVMTTFWIYFLGTPLLGKHIQIPYTQLVVSLVSLFVPVLLGIIFKKKQPQKAEIVKKYVSKPFFLLILIIVPSMGISTHFFVFYLMTWRHIVCGVLLGILGYTFGAGLAALFCQGLPQMIAISMETAIQNAGISYVALNLTLTSPYSDIASLPMIAFILLTTGPMIFVFYAIFFTCNKIKGRMGASEKVDKEEPFHDTRDSVDIGDIKDEENI